MRWIAAAFVLVAVALYDCRRRLRAAHPERRFRELAHDLPLIVWSQDAEGAIDYGNRRFLEFLGRTEGEAEVPLLCFKALVPPEEYEAVSAEFRRCFAAGIAYDAELRLRPPGTDVAACRRFAVRVAPFGHGRGVRWLGFASDVHDRTLALEQRDVQLRSLAEAAPIVVWRARPDGHVDYFNSRWSELTGLGMQASTGSGWMQALHPADVATTTQSWRRALKSHLPYEVEYRLRDARGGGFRWQLVRATPQLDEFHNVVAWLGSCTDIDDKKRSEANLRLLIDSGTQLLSSLGVRESFQAVVGVLVPEYADWAAVSSVNEAGLPCVVAIRHHDRRLDARAHELLGTTYGRRGIGIAAAAAKGVPQVWTRLPSDWLAGVEEPVRSELLSFGTMSAVSVPIRVGHRVAAILTLGRARGERGFEERDLPTYCELARRIGIATKNAESYENERRVAASFQRAALPAVLPQNARVAFDAVYEAGRSEALVGGDWYDAFELADGRVVVSIGDVSGNGLAAAVTMSVVRQSIRAAARIEAEPVAILDAADRTLRGDDPERIVTAFVGIFDPATSEFSFAGAGHPPPLHRLPDGTVEELRSAGAPLGLRRRGGTARSGTAPLSNGALVVLYTDGLTEATRDVFEGERLLHAALADETVVAAEAPAHAIARSVLLGGSGDDVAILTLRVREAAASGGAPAPRSWTLHPGDAERSAAARREFGDALQEAGVNRARAALSELVFGELVSNAVRHGAGPIEVRLEWSERRPVLHVLDQGPGYRFTAPRPVDQLSESGRGLLLVSMLTDDFNVSPRSGGGSHSRAVLACRAAPSAAREISGRADGFA